MKKIIMIILSIIFVIATISIIVDRRIYPRIYNKRVDSGYYYTNIEEDTPQEETKQEEKKEQEVIKLDVNSDNIARIYINEFLGFINKNDMKAAYEMLGSNFKKINFKTQEEFEKYWRKNYPEYVLIYFDNIEQVGPIVLANVSINDLYGKIDIFKTTFSVIKENNKYKVSFEIKE